MGSVNLSEVAYLPGTVTRSVKLLVAGHFGVGKTTFVGSVSEIRPLRTEEPITEASVGVDDIALTGGKTTTTVALDFGRISIANEYVLFLFGMPGQERFWFMWDQLCIGALGVIVLVDTRRIEDSFEAVDYFERTGIPFLVAVNEFEGAQFAYNAVEVREALQLRAEVPVVMCDARSRTSAVNVLIALVKHLQTIDYRTVRPAAPEQAAHEGSYI